jgi:hypothetical protein
VGSYDGPMGLGRHTFGVAFVGCSPLVSAEHDAVGQTSAGFMRARSRRQAFEVR